MGRIVYECSGCGTVTHDAEKQLKLLHDAGKISCCPERKMLPAYLTSGERSPDHDTLSEAYNLALADAAEKVGEILGADEWGEDGYHLGVSIRDLKKPVALPAISLDEIGALFFECGGVPVSRGRRQADHHASCAQQLRH